MNDDKTKVIANSVVSALILFVMITFASLFDKSILDYATGYFSWLRDTVYSVSGIYLAGVSILILFSYLVFVCFVSMIIVLIGALIISIFDGRDGLEPLAVNIPRGSILQSTQTDRVKIVSSSAEVLNKEKMLWKWELKNIRIITYPGIRAHVYDACIRKRDGWLARKRCVVVCELKDNSKESASRYLKTMGILRRSVRKDTLEYVLENFVRDEDLFLSELQTDLAHDQRALFQKVCEYANPQLSKYGLEVKEAHITIK